MRKKHSLILVILLITIFYSQNYEQILDFEKVKLLAIENNLSLKNYENQMKLAKLSYDQALANLYFPSISISSSTSIPFDPAKNVSTQLNLNISKPIFNGFSLQKAKDLAYINYQNKKSIYEIKLLETKFYAFQYYYQYLEKLLEYKLYSEILKINEKRMNEYNSKFRLGLITELDFISLQLTFYKVELSFKNAENEKDLAYIKLKSFLNLKEDFKIFEEQNLENLDFSKIFDIKQIELDIESNKINATGILNDAKKFDISYLTALLNYEQADINLRYYLASLFPNLSASFGISYSGVFESNSLNSTDPSLNLSLSITLDLDSLIPGSVKSLELTQLKKELENAMINLQETENDLFLSLETSLKNIILSKKSKENALIRFNYLTKGYQLAQDAFNLGQISASEYASWEEEYINAKISLYSSILNYQLNLQAILLAIGGIDEKKD